MKHQAKYHNSGFTILELIISMAVGMVILTALISTFVLQRDQYEVQEQKKNMAFTARAAMDMISREVASGGYNPTGKLQGDEYPLSTDGENTPFVGVVYNTSVLEIISDLNGDEDNTDENERIRYMYDSDLKQIKRSTTAIGETDEWLPFAENIASFTFKFFMEDGTTEVDTSLPTAKRNNSIRTVQLAITARTEKPDADFNQNDGYRFTTLLSNVKVRNLGLKKPLDSTTTSSSSTTSDPYGSTTIQATTTSTVPDGFIEEDVALTTTEGETSTTTTVLGETTTSLVETTTAWLPTDCIVRLAIGTCITANNNGDVLMRVHVVDYATFEPISNAIVNWSVKNLDSGITYDYGMLLPWGSGWYGGSGGVSCSCEELDLDDGIPFDCATTNPFDLANEPDFKKDKFNVALEVELGECGGGVLVITPEMMSDAAAG